MRELNKAMVDLLEEQGSVTFETLAVENKASMLKLLRVIDRANGYVHIPGSALSGANGEGGMEAMEGGAGMKEINLEDMPDIDELGDIDDVQERWGQNKALYDEEEEKAWEKEWSVRGGRPLAPSTTIVRPERPREEYGAGELP